MPLDWREGRVLAALVPMTKIITHEGDEGEFVPFPRRDDVTDLAVCDPISRRYVIIPAIPGDLITSGEQRDCLFDFNAFLAPATEEEMADSSFRVVATAQCKSKLFVFVFSSRSEEWRKLSIRQWEHLRRGCELVGAGSGRFLLGPALLCTLPLVLGAEGDGQVARS